MNGLMNRQIKFRAWHNTLNKFLASDEWCLGLDGELMFINIYDDCGPSPVADPNLYTLEQFTGLTDKNGKEIYEGDIIKAIYPNASFVNEAEQITAVKWAYDRWAFKNKTAGFYFSCFFYPEVIGNIHENPELLKND